MIDSGWTPGEQDTVTAVFARAVQQFADHIFLDVGGEQASYATFESLTNRLANGLRALGVERGDRVGALLDTSIDAVAAWVAVNKLGAIHVPVNAAYKGEYLRHQFADAGVGIIICEPDYAERIYAIRDGLPELRTVLRRGAEPVGDMAVPTLRLADALGGDDAMPDICAPADVSMLIYTGGTTGPSKGCIVSHNYACNLARQAVVNGDRTSADINWSPLPLFHMNALCGTVLATAMAGGTAALFARFSVSRFWAEIERSGATIANLLGSMLSFIAEQPDSAESLRCFGQLRAIRGSPFPAALQEKWKRRFGVRVAGSNVYGLTEATCVTSLPDSEYAKPGSSGKRNDDFDVRIVDDHDNEVPHGTPGEIIIRPRKPHVMFEGYWGRPAETLTVMRNMWLHSGDIGMFDEDGFFFFVDRKKDYLRRRGENISSFEVETTFRAHPAIQDVAIHSVFSETAEDEVKATIVLKTEMPAVTEESICRWSVEQLPYFAVPRYIEIREDLPRNPVGRVLKYVLRDEGCTPTTWDREAAGIVLAKR